MLQKNLLLKQLIKANIILRQIRIKLKIGEHNDVKVLFDTLNSLNEWKKDKYNKSIFFMLYGLFYEQEGAFSKSLFYYKKASILKKEVNDLSGYASCLLNAGNMEKKLKNYKNALMLYTKAKAIYKKLHSNIKEAGATLNILSLFYAMKKHVDINDYKYLENVFTKHKRYESLIVLYEVFADYSYMNKNKKQALLYINKGMKFAKKLNDIYGYAILYLKKGLYEYYDNNKKQSIKYFKIGLDVLNNYDGNNNLKVLFNYNIADIYRELGNIKESIKYFNNVIHLDKNKSDMFFEAKEFLKKYKKEEK